MSKISNLQRILSQGYFAITAEIGPPKGANPDSIIKKCELLNSYADAFNVTDNQTAVVRLSSMAGCCHLLKKDLEPY